MIKLNYDALGFEFADLEKISNQQIVKLCRTGHRTWKETFNTPAGHILVTDYEDAHNGLRKDPTVDAHRKPNEYWPILAGIIASLCTHDEEIKDQKLYTIAAKACELYEKQTGQPIKITSDVQRYVRKIKAGIDNPNFAEPITAPSRKSKSEKSL